MAELELRVLWLYPDHMNIYADRGNIAVLERRCAWRGIGFAVTPAGPQESFDPEAHEQDGVRAISAGPTRSST